MLHVLFNGTTLVRKFMLALTTGCICGSAQNFLLSGRDGPVAALSLSEGALEV
jgi:hypothetical protein